MKVLVTGAGGFVGRHLLQELAGEGHEPIYFDINPPGVSSATETHTGDLRDIPALQDLIQQVRPDACIHLGGIAFVPMGWSDPEHVLTVNLMGTVNLLETFRHHAPNTRVLIVSSAEVYGRGSRPAPIGEDAPIHPDNPYGISKVGADLMGLLYAKRYAMPIMTARPGNHIGPGQSPRFVATAFADQLARIEAAQSEPVLHVGNLEGERDFADVRDVVRAYRLLIEHGIAGEAYNIASGHMITIRQLLDILISLSTARPAVETDPARYRATENPPALNIGKIKAHTEWAPIIPLETTLKSILKACRSESVR